MTSKEAVVRYHELMAQAKQAKGPASEPREGG